MCLPVPHADLLFLIGEVQSISVVKVVRLDRSRGGAKEVLDASLWSQVAKVAGKLTDLRSTVCFTSLFLLNNAKAVLFFCAGNEP